ncbi:MAG: restriction endonuclease subunit S [Comamonadaceae bacterium]|nr:restriction endonuclease subunit S [Burkholderiales bacterium]MEB2347870.1 restriction endonuclease subunit S [Comamonadaceae bacterium]
MAKWKECLLGDVVNLKRGYDLPHNARSSGPYPVISSSGITDHHSEAKVKGPGVVTGRYGTLGQVFFVQNDYWPLNTSLYVEDFKGNDPRFISYFLGTLHFGSHNAAGAVPGINRNHLHALRVNIPPLPTQRRIASILSAYDELIENSQRRIKILETMARALYREWFVHFRFPGHENVPRVPSALGEIPQGWEVGRLDNALVLQRGFDLPKSDRVEGDIPIFAATGITGFHSEAKVKAPGVVTGRSGTIGEVIYVQEDYWPLNTALWVKEFPRSEPLYAYYLLASINLKQFNSGAAVPTLNRNDVHSLEVIIPPRNLQKQFQEIAGAMFKGSRALQRQIQTLRRTRDLLLPRLLSGQIAVEALPA